MPSSCSLVQLLLLLPVVSEALALLSLACCSAKSVEIERSSQPVGRKRPTGTVTFLDERIGRFHGRVLLVGVAVRAGLRVRRPNPVARLRPVQSARRPGRLAVAAALLRAHLERGG